LGLAIRLAILLFGNSVWQFCLVIQFDKSVQQFSLVILFGNLVWQFGLAIQFGNLVWQFSLAIQFGNLVPQFSLGFSLVIQICLAIRFGKTNSIWQFANSVRISIWDAKSVCQTI
jgi:hypothetical protein